MNERDFCRINDLLMRKLRHWLVNDECQWIGDGVNMGLCYPAQQQPRTSTTPCMYTGIIWR